VVLDGERVNPLLRTYASVSAACDLGLRAAAALQLGPSTRMGHAAQLEDRLGHAPLPEHVLGEQAALELLCLRNRATSNLARLH
jgi:hypothetical protein